MLYKSFVDKTTGDVLDERFLKTVDDRDYAIFVMGLLVGKQVYGNGGNPVVNIIEANIDDILVSTPTDNIRYRMVEE